MSKIESIKISFDSDSKPYVFVQESGDTEESKERIEYLKKILSMTSELLEEEKIKEVIIGDRMVPFAECPYCGSDSPGGSGEKDQIHYISKKIENSKGQERECFNCQRAFKLPERLKNSFAW